MLMFFSYQDPKWRLREGIGQVPMVELTFQMICYRYMKNYSIYSENQYIPKVFPSQFEHKNVNEHFKTFFRHFFVL